MPVKTLEVIRYPPDGIGVSGNGWESVQHPAPSWATVESAIRRLDRDEYPYVWLYAAEPVYGEVPENALCIMGGHGEYAIFLARHGDEISYLDSSRSDTSVRIWESDQGSVKREKELCNNLATVLAIAKHFSEVGQLFPGVCWME